MKIFLLILVVVVMSVSTFACNNNGTSPGGNNGSGGGDELIGIIPLKDRAGDYAVTYGIDSFGNSAQMILVIAADGTGSIISTGVDKNLTPGTPVNGTFGDVNSTETSFTFSFDGDPTGESTITFIDNNTVTFVPAGTYFGTAGTEYTLTKPNTELSTREGEYKDTGGTVLDVTVFTDGKIKFLPGSSDNTIQFAPDSKNIKFDYKDGIYIIFTSANTLTLYHPSAGEFQCSK